MDRFVSNFTNRLDSKGRVSIPATFRSVMAKDGFEGLYVHPALDAPALDAGGNTLLKEIDAFLSTLSPYSDERDQLSTALFGTSEILKVDTEGRVILTESVKLHAGIADQVTFVGLGHKFQIWEPEGFRAHLEAARAKVRDFKRTFGLRGVAPDPDTRAPTARATPPGAREQ
ncbi:MAG: division/cell wall cluster transcriptional repressor MraZ [Microvirga sp.]|nr:division/cell wall cluster transcriptional repressor MraZ [Microvirga sp.]